MAGSAVIEPCWRIAIANPILVVHSGVPAAFQAVPGYVKTIVLLIAHDVIGIIATAVIFAVARGGVVTGSTSGMGFL